MPSIRLRVLDKDSGILLYNTNQTIAVLFPRYMARGGTRLKYKYDKHKHFVEDECIFPKIPTHDSNYKHAYSSKTQIKDLRKTTRI